MARLSSSALVCLLLLVNQIECFRNYRFTRKYWKFASTSISLLKKTSTALSMQTDDNHAQPDYSFTEYSNVDLYGDRTDITDEEILNKMREARILYNDGWQSTIFHDEHCGTWIGKVILKPKYF
jgi:hypothetical protein